MTPSLVSILEANKFALSALGYRFNADRLWDALGRDHDELAAVANIHAAAFQFGVHDHYLLSLSDVLAAVANLAKESEPMTDERIAGMKWKISDPPGITWNVEGGGLTTICSEAPCFVERHNKDVDRLAAAIRAAERRGAK